MKVTTIIPEPPATVNVELSRQEVTHLRGILIYNTAPLDCCKNFAKELLVAIKDA